MSRSINPPLPKLTPTKDQHQTRSLWAALTQKSSRGAFWCSLGALVVALATPGAAQGQNEPSAPAQPEAQPAQEASTPEDRAVMCLENHANGQEYRLSGKLLEGREAFLQCSATHCPAQIQRDCLNYMEQIQLQIPSVAFRVSADGVSRTDVKVYIDGNLVLEKISGKALDLNPGSHELRVVLEPFAPYEQVFVMTEGDKFRMMEVKFASPVVNVPDPSVPQQEMHRPIPLESYIFGSVSAAALISGVAWGLSSWGLKGDLEENCAPRCPKDSVNVLRQRSLIADISFGASAASLAAAGLFYLLRPEIPVDGPVDVGVTVLGDHGAIGTIGVTGF